jgi:hypothetical protein
LRKVNDRIEKIIELIAAISRVRRALIDYHEFGEWFGVKLDGPLVPGQVSRGHITQLGYAHVEWEAVVQAMEPERLFSFTWHPYAPRPRSRLFEGNAYAHRIQARENRRRHAATAYGVRLRPDPEWPPRRSFRMNDGGWTPHLKNIERYIAQKP